MLDVGEGPARGQQIEQLAIERAFALVFQVMNGEAGDDGVERRVRRDRVAPGGRGQIGLHERRLGRQRREPLSGGGEHGRREIDEHRLGGGVAREQHRAEDAIPRTQIEESPHRLPAVRDDLEHHRELFPSKRNRAAHRIEKPADGLFLLPCGRCQVILSDHLILHA